MPKQSNDYPKPNRNIGYLKSYHIQRLSQALPKPWLSQGSTIQSIPKAQLRINSTLYSFYQYNQGYIHKLANSSKYPSAL